MYDERMWHDARRDTMSASTQQVHAIVGRDRETRQINSARTMKIDVALPNH